MSDQAPPYVSPVTLAIIRDVDRKARYLMSPTTLAFIREADRTWCELQPSLERLAQIAADAEPVMEMAEAAVRAVGPVDQILRHVNAALNERGRIGVSTRFEWNVEAVPATVENLFDSVAAEDVEVVAREVLSDPSRRAVLQQVADAAQSTNPAQWSTGERLIAAASFLFTLGIAIPVVAPAAVETVYTNMLALATVIAALAALLKKND